MKTKSCDNCYFKLVLDNQGRFCTSEYNRPLDNVCNNHEFGCDICKRGDVCYTEPAEYLYDGKYYCEDCLQEELGIEKRKYASYAYYDSHGNYLGNSDEVDFEDLMLNNPQVMCLNND